MLGAVRSLAVGARDRFDKARHPARRESVIHSVRSEQVEHLLFVCLGNICRSPFAEALAVAGGLDADSVGFIGPGRNPPHEAIASAQRAGIDTASHVSRQITAEDVERADLVVVFDRFNVQRVKASHPTALSKTVWLGDFDPQWVGKRAIIDPWGRGEEFFDATFERIERCLEELRSAISAD